MLKITLLVLLAISLGLANGGGSDLPSYISPCSLSDPNLDKCLVKKANEAIPIVLKGDVTLNIPPVSPVVYAIAPINGIGLKYILYDVFSDDWKTFRVTDGYLDVKNSQGGITGVLDRVEITARNYEIVEGKIVDIPVYGQGKYNVTFVGLKIHFSGKVRVYTKGEDKYLDYFDTKADTSCDRTYVHFENLQSTEKEDVNAYIDKEWEKFFAQIKPALDSYTNAFYMFPVTAITTAVPLNKLFLP